MKATPASRPGTALPGRTEPRRQRADGAEARQHLLEAALRLFADRGFDKTSTRDIAQAAGANVAAISYYFGDKAGLYRAVFREPMGTPCHDVSRYLAPHLTLRQSLEAFIASFIEPMKQGDLAQQIARLHFREMLEPTGLWAEQIDQRIRPAHAALVKVLGRHLAAREDDDLHRLAFSIAGLAMQIFITREVIDNIRPRLIATPAALDTWGRRLADQAEALVAVEAARRQARRDARPAAAGQATASRAARRPPSSPPLPLSPARQRTRQATASRVAAAASPAAQPPRPRTAPHDRKPAKT